MERVLLNNDTKLKVFARHAQMIHYHMGLFLEAVFKLRTQCIILPYKLLAYGAAGTTNISILDPQHMQSPNCKNCQAQ